MKVELLSNGDLEKKGKSPLGWLRLKGVPFSCFRYKYERLGISVVEAGERAGNLSFWSEKRLKKGQQMRFNVCEKVTKTFWFGDLLIL